MRTHDIQLEHIIEQLNDIQSLLRSHANASSRIVLNGMEKDIVAVVAEKPLKASSIARRMNCKYDSHFRATMSFLVRAGVLEKTRKGYAPFEGDVNSVICDEPTPSHMIPTDQAN